MVFCKIMETYFFWWFWRFFLYFLQYSGILGSRETVLRQASSVLENALKNKTVN